MNKLRSTVTAVEVASRVDLSGRYCLVTGATSGLGRESVRALAAAGAEVILTGRTAPALAATQTWVRERVPPARLHCVPMELGSLASVAAAAGAVAGVTARLHVLMNNAGVMFTPFARTSDGFELHFGINHLGHFEFTRRLVPLLIAAGGARVVTLSSGGYRLGDVDLDDPDWRARPYDKFAAYGASKSANLLHTRALHARLGLEGVSCVAVNPGPVATDLARHMSAEDFSTLRRIAAAGRSREGDPPDGGRLEFRTPDAGAATQVWAATATELNGVGGLYLEDCAVSRDVTAQVMDPARAEHLWEISEALCDQALAAPR